MSSKIKSTEALDTWLTPLDFYNELNSRFNFNKFDPCPPDNDLELFNGLEVDWTDITFCNPPYSQKLKEKFIYKAYAESMKGKVSVLLLPVSTSTKIFHELIKPNARIEFLKGRIKFEGIDRTGNWVNPYTGMYTLENTEGRTKINRSGQTDSMIVIFGDKNNDF